MTTHEVLVAARNLIDREGHLKEDLGGHERGFCAWGACLRASSPFSENRSAYDEAGRILALTIDLSFCGRANYARLAGWNDDPSRTKEQVLDAFDKAIAETAPLPADPFESFTVNRISFRDKVKA